MHSPADSGEYAATSWDRRPLRRTRDECAAKDLASLRSVQIRDEAARTAMRAGSDESRVAARLHPISKYPEATAADPQALPKSGQPVRRAQFRSLIQPSPPASTASAARH